MKRRKFVAGAAAGLALGAGSTYLAMRDGEKAPAGAIPANGPKAPAVAKGVQELSMVTSWPKNFPGLGTTANHLAKIITDMSDGRYTVKVFAGGELVPALKCLDAVQEGTADLYHSAEYYYQGKSKAFNFFTTVPFGLTSFELNAWIYHGGGQKLWDELSAQFNVKPFLAGNSGVQMGGWFRKEINSLEDFRGLKMRIPGLGGAVVSKLGGTTVTLPAAEVFQALQSGTIDATEWVGPWNDLALGFYKVAKNYYYPGFHEPGSAFSGGISLKLWESLSASDKAMFQTAMAATNDFAAAEFHAKNSQALDTLVRDHGVQLRKFSDEIVKAIAQRSEEVVAEIGESDPATRKVYESYRDFRRISKSWSNLADQAFMNARSL